jgi:tetratricopeptide (TPR) repeat protein/predicted aspartyl protease
MAALAAIAMSSGIAAARCQLQQIAVLPVEMHGLRPLVSTKINGVEARFVLDTGAFYSTLSRDAAAQYQLRVTPAPGNALTIAGIGGEERAQIATVDSFDYLGTPLSKVGFFVIDQNGWDGTVGLLGQNLLRISDVEYDLADGLVRFIKPVDCGDQPLAYWAVSTPYSFVKLKYMGVVRSHMLATALIDGHRITVAFDTGASRSYLSLRTAERLGITPGSPGVKLLGAAGGIGPETVKMWSAQVATFQIGGEKVAHANLLIGQMAGKQPIGVVSSESIDMLLGDDFFLSHRIYVAYSQKRLYFTYNGGPLFNLNLPQVISGKAKPPASAGAAPQAAAAAGKGSISNTPTDADGFRRQGMAYASMQEFDRALADLTHACELAPGDAEDRYDRGVVYAQDGQYAAALKDFDSAITLRPDDIDAHLARAQLLQSQPATDPADGAATIRSDLDAVSRLAAPAAAVRLTLSELYEKLGNYSAAVGQIDQWLDTHRLPNDQATGLNDRCWLRATANRDLRAALDDCNHALYLSPHSPERVGTYITKSLEQPDTLDSRGLVYLRLGEAKDAIRDYDTALDVNPKMPTALYGRGLAELRLGRKARGEKDLASAEKIDGGIAKLFAGMGLTP